jgi:hypothetical protein
MGCHLVMAFGVALPALIPGLAAIAAAALCVGGTLIAILMLGMQEARRVAGEDAAPLMATMTASFGAGQVIGPLSVSALVGPAEDFAVPLLLAAAALIVSGLALLGGAKRPRAE